MWAAAGRVPTKETAACALQPWPQPAREETGDRDAHHTPGMPAAEMTRSFEIFHLTQQSDTLENTLKLLILWTQSQYNQDFYKDEQP